MDVKSKPGTDFSLLSPGWQPQLAEPQLSRATATFAHRSVAPKPTLTRASSYFDLSKVEDKSPLPKPGKLSHARSFMNLSGLPPSPDEPKTIMPPEFLEEHEYITLCHLLCNRLELPHEVLSPKQLCRFCEQAIKDLEYLSALANKCIKNQIKVPAGIRLMIIVKLLGQVQSYDTLIKDFKDALKTFKKNTTIKSEIDLYPSVNFPAKPWVVTTSQTDMLIEMKKNWRLLVRFMELWRAVMPAPSQYCSWRKTMTPEMLKAISSLPKKHEKDPVPLKERANQLRCNAYQLQENWKALDVLVSAGKIDKFALPTDEALKHIVRLPQEIHALPPVHDLTELYADEEKTAPKRFMSGWCIPNVLESSELSTRKQYFETKKQAQANCKLLKTKAKKKSSKSAGLAVSVTVPRPEIMLLNPKPENYFDYQPIADATLQQVLKKGSLRIRQAIPPLEGLCEKLERGAEVTEEEYGRFREICETVRESLNLWERHIPSLQSILDSIYASEGKLSQRAKVVSEKFKSLYQDSHKPKPMKPLKRSTTETEMSPATTAKKLFSKLSMPELLAEQEKEPKQRSDPIALGVIPPTPSPSASLSSGSPRFLPSPVTTPLRTSPPPSEEGSQ